MLSFVIPAKAGINASVCPLLPICLGVDEGKQTRSLVLPWVRAFAGTTSIA
jgi:hypothetical protein